MVSCLLSSEDEKKIRKMFSKKAKLELASKKDPSKEKLYFKCREDIILFTYRKLEPALHARAETWATRGYCDRADAVSMIQEHLVQAVDKFKPERGNCKWTSFLWTVSNRSFSNFLSSNNRKKRNPRSSWVQDSDPVIPLDSTISKGSIGERYLISLDETTSASLELDETALTIADTVVDPYNFEDAFQFETLLNSIHERCTDEQKLLLQLLQENYTYKEIAKHLNIPPTTVSRHIQTLRRKLKDDLKFIRDLI